MAKTLFRWQPKLLKYYEKMVYSQVEQHNKLVEFLDVARKKNNKIMQSRSMSIMSEDFHTDASQILKSRDTSETQAKYYLVYDYIDINEEEPQKKIAQKY